MLNDRISGTALRLKVFAVFRMLRGFWTVVIFYVRVVLSLSLENASNKCNDRCPRPAIHRMLYHQVWENGESHNGYHYVQPKCIQII